MYCMCVHGGAGRPARASETSLPALFRKALCGLSCDEIVQQLGRRRGEPLPIVGAIEAGVVAV
jgi:hypothetical protein